MPASEGEARVDPAIEHPCDGATAECAMTMAEIIAYVQARYIREFCRPESLSILDPLAEGRDRHPPLCAEWREIADDALAFIQHRAMHNPAAIREILRHMALTARRMDDQEAGPCQRA